MKNGGPAFPTDNVFDGTGMTLWDYFAGNALQGWVTGCLLQTDEVYGDKHDEKIKGKKVSEVLASEAANIADAMIKEREKRLKCS
jgi:hypothetical protein